MSKTAAIYKISNPNELRIVTVSRSSDMELNVKKSTHKMIEINDTNNHILEDPRNYKAMNGKLKKKSIADLKKDKDKHILDMTKAQ
jgi:hypothetical protein